MHVLRGTNSACHVCRFHQNKRNAQGQRQRQKNLKTTNKLKTKKGQFRLMEKPANAKVIMTYLVFVGLVVYCPTASVGSKGQLGLYATIVFPIPPKTLLCLAFAIFIYMSLESRYI